MWVKIEKIYNALYSLNSDINKDIIELISDREMNQADITYEFSNEHYYMSQSYVSQALKVLVLAGVVLSRKDGKLKLYKLNFELLEKLNEFSKRLNEVYELN